jgi:hypothetical protein
VNETCKILVVKYLNSSAYLPQGHAQVERYHRTINQGLSHYVNASGTNWDSLIPFYLMAYRATPHGSTGYSPYYLLHGREMILPTTQDIKANLPPDLRGTDYAGRLENLKSSLKSAYKTVRRNIRNSHGANKKYYDRRAKERNFKVDDVIYLYSPVMKPGECRKFRKFRNGPFKVTARLSSLNYRIVTPQGKEFTVHVNRMKPAYNPEIWETTQKKRPPRKTRVRLQGTREHEEIRAPGPIMVPAPQAGNRPMFNEPPNQTSPRRGSTPQWSPPELNTPGSIQTDPNYIPPDTPRSRRELSTSRQDNPHALPSMFTYATRR